MVKRMMITALAGSNVAQTQSQNNGRENVLTSFISLYVPSSHWITRKESEVYAWRKMADKIFNPAYFGQKRNVRADWYSNLIFTWGFKVEVFLMSLHWQTNSLSNAFTIMAALGGFLSRLLLSARGLKWILFQHENWINWINTNWFIGACCLNERHSCGPS